MGSGAVIYVSSFIKIGSGVQKSLGMGIHRQTNKHTHTHTWTGTWSHKPTLFFKNKENRLKNKNVYVDLHVGLFLHYTFRTELLELMIRLTR
jgi:hypothetical protein